jgi:type I restriction enzyme S subunit
VNVENRARLPAGWEWTTIGKIADTTSGGTPLRSHPEYYKGDIPWIKSGELRDRMINSCKETITESGLRNSSAKIFIKDTVVVALYGATVGRTGILGLNASTNQAVCGIFPKNNSFISKYMFYWLQSQRQNLVDKSMGGAQPNISQGIIRSLAFPLPPLSEQERIVERIESLFTQLDAGVAGLKRLQAALKRYKSSVLKAVFSGNPKWKWKKLGNITNVLRGASPRPKGNPKYYGGSIPWIKISDVTKENGKYLTTTVDTVTHEGAKKSKYLTKGSLILSICATVCVPKILAIDGCVHDGFVYFPDLPPEIDSSFLYYYFESIRSKVIQENRQGMTQVNLNTGIVSNFKIPVLPPDEQIHIVAELEKQLSVMHELEQTIDANLKRAGRLRQAILKKAFEGRLT